MAGEIAKLSVLLTVEDKLTDGLKGATRELDATAKGMAGLGAAMSAAAAVGVAAFGSAVAAAAEFEQSISNIRAVLGPAQFAAFGTELEALAKRLGKDTVF